MSHGIQQVVGRLRTIGKQDRDWLLGRLSAEERRRVLTALVGDSAVPVNGEGSNGADKTRSGNLASTAKNGAHDPELAALRAASASDIAELLSGESDWTIVVLLQHQNWSWAEEYLRSLSISKLRTLRELENELGDAVRPKVKETIARIVGRRLRPHDSDSVDKRSVFDAMLDHVQSNGQMTSQRPGSVE